MVVQVGCLIPMNVNWWEKSEGPRNWKRSETQRAHILDIQRYIYPFFTIDAQLDENATSTLTS